MSKSNSPNMNSSTNNDLPETSSHSYSTDGVATSHTDGIPQMEPMFYSLTESTSREALETMKSLTNNFDASAKMTPAFVSALTQRLDNDEPIHEGFLYAPNNSDITKQVIGRDGCYFHQTTTKQDIAMIWHDTTRQRPIFRFWGDKFKVIKAMNIIRHRIHMKTYQQ